MKQSLLLCLCLFLGSFPFPLVGQQSKEESEPLRARVQQLEKENARLRTENLQLRADLMSPGGPQARARLMRAIERLQAVRQQWKRTPDNAQLRQEAITLGRKIAISQTFARTGWEVLI